MNSLENQILQIITQNINHKLSIDYKFELLLYNLDLSMAPIPEARPRGDLIQLTATSFDSSPLRSS